MIKKSLVATIAAAVIALPLSVQAQAFAGNTNRTCSVAAGATFVGITPSKCSGFWGGNLLNIGAGQTVDADEAAGLAALGIVNSSSVKVIQKLDLTDGGGGIDFTALLTGQTVLGIHWGKGNTVFDGTPSYNFTDDSKGLGGGTSFYLFNASSSIDVLTFSSIMNKSQSGATLYATGGKDGGGVLPRNSTLKA